MKKTIQNISIIGDGGWGTTLAIHLTQKGFDVCLWGAFPDYVQKMQQNRVNNRFLPGIRFPKSLNVISNIKQAVDHADLIVFATPSQYIQKPLKNIAKCDYKNKIFLSVIKGIDTKTFKTMSQTIQGQLKGVDVAILSGPNIAKEVAKGIPSTAVIASKSRKIASQLQDVFSSDTFRIYTNTDVVGVELAGSMKNVMAIACGVCDGLGYGSNTKSALLTRGLAEMTRLGVKLKAKKETFYGLAGLGDLATTSFSPHSRNRTFGEQIGKGLSIKQVQAKMHMVAEGVPTAKALYQLAQKRKVNMPITYAVYQMLYKHKNPQKVVKELMTRELRSE